MNDIKEMRLRRRKRIFALRTDRSVECVQRRSAPSRNKKRIMRPVLCLWKQIPTHTVNPKYQCGWTGNVSCTAKGYSCRPDFEENGAENSHSVNNATRLVSVEKRTVWNWYENHEWIRACCLVRGTELMRNRPSAIRKSELEDIIALRRAPEPEVDPQRLWSSSASRREIWNRWYARNHKA
jgi:hypothetical protein